MPTALNGDEWKAVLERLAAALPPAGPPIRLCLIGSAACVFGGMTGRTTLDLDIWKPASDYDFVELKTAAEKAGLIALNGSNRHSIAIFCNALIRATSLAWAVSHSEQRS